ncbi:MAG: DNA helicase RecQ [Candidatus Sericytochromatia bacterium]
MYNTLKKYFGYTEFRPLQEDIIKHTLDGYDSLVLMPTGGGKSLCFQIPAIIKEGICIVISPLISLMKDQVDSLISNGIESAFLNSSLGYEEQSIIEKKCLSGLIKILYVSPEKLLSNGFLFFLKKLKLNLFAIDEAHCISSWGHDFRPEYTKLSFLKENFPHIPIMALTATADKITRKDIINQLNLQNHKMFISSFDRPNISLSVLAGQNRIKHIINFIMARRKTSGIIYCLSRKTCESTAQKLREVGINAEYYHAGLSSEERNDIQERFIKDETQVICATIAFGMGINKPDVRWVIHYNLPKNLEGYYQEIGRAGRDNLKSEAVLFYTFADIMNLKKMFEESSQKELQNIKLERMQQYAETMMCRRKILINYFGESFNDNCNNCDICKNPPTYLDGTIITQKALSAIWWLGKINKKVSQGILIDILRGAHKKEILENEYNNIKTYGAGKDISYQDWQSYITQILNLGFIEIAYDENYVLKFTESSKKVLSGEIKVNLIDAKKYKTLIEENIKKQSIKPTSINDTLFEHLKSIRRDIAQKENIPPYIVFGDATLEQMAKERPITENHMKRISGVGEKKFDKYGDIFINAIFEFLKNQNTEGQSKNATYVQTYDLYKQNLSLKEIADKRNLSESTISSHLAYLYENNYDIDLYKFVDPKEMNKIFNTIKKVGNDIKLREIFDILEQKIDYNKIRFGLAYYTKKVSNISN